MSGRNKSKTKKTTTAKNTTGPPLPEVKRIRLYRNGDDNFPGKDVVVDKRMASMDQLLQTATDCVQKGIAARSIRTTGGEIVEKLEDLSDKGDYVVVGYGKFNDKIEYSELRKRYEERQKNNRENAKKPPDEPPYEDSERLKNSVGAKYNDVGDTIPIFVYSNGNDTEPARRVLLTRPMMKHWELIFAHISNFILPESWATQQLCTVDGQRVVHKADIEAEKRYVAVGNGLFKKLDYESAESKKRPAFIVSPKFKKKPVHEEDDRSRRSSVCSEG